MGMISRLVAKDAGLIHFEGQDLAKWNSRELSKTPGDPHADQQHFHETDGAGTGQLRPFPLLSGKASEGGPAESGGSAGLHGAGSDRG